MSGRPLSRHLASIVLLKLAALVALWALFVRDARVDVDVQAAATRMVEVAPPPPSPPSPLP
jgi:hypothetical protein